MVIVLLALVALVAAVGVAVLLGRIPARGVLPPVSTESFDGLPRGEVDPDDLAGVRFDPALRGYRMSQVDAVLARLSEELRRRDADIARLQELTAGEPVPGTGTGAGPGPDQGEPDEAGDGAG